MNLDKNTIIKKKSFSVNELLAYDYFFDIEINLNKKKFNIEFKINNKTHILKKLNDLGIPIEKAILLKDFVKLFLMEEFQKKEDQTITQSMIDSLFYIIKVKTGIIVGKEDIKVFLEGFKKS